MVDKVAPVPKGFRTATPYLTVRGAAQAIAFYQAAFEAEEVERFTAEDGMTVVHAQLKIGNSVLFLCDEQPHNGILSPAALGGSGTLIHLYVKDAETLWQNALEVGALPVAPLNETYWGDLSGKLIDPFGHVWSIASKVKRVASDEIRAQARGEVSGDVLSAPTDDQAIVAPLA
ncbi:MAG: VOC family protein [Pseudomonadota bacterium]